MNRDLLRRHGARVAVVALLLAGGGTACAQQPAPSGAQAPARTSAEADSLLPRADRGRT